MDNIFGHFLIKPNDDEETAYKRLAHAAWFVDAIPQTEFNNDELLYWKFLEYSSQLEVPPNLRTLEVWIATELRKVLLDTHARVAGCEALNYEEPVAFETALSITRGVLVDDYNALEMNDNIASEFKVDCDAYFSTQRKNRITEILSRGYDMLGSTDDPIKASDYLMDSLLIINDIYDVEKLEELDGKSGTVKRRPRFACDTGLPAIDKDSGGFYTTQLIGIEAQPGTGKTRFVLGDMIYRAATIHHKNCLYLSLEQNEIELEAMLIAKHVFVMFGHQIADKLIWEDRVPDEMKAEVEAARIDLFQSGKYGKITYKRIDLYVETFTSKLRTLCLLGGGYDVIAIDYIGLIGSKPAKYHAELKDAEIIKQAYQRFKRFCSKNDILGIAIAQFNKEGIEAGEKDKEITVSMAQGGQAVYRNTDYNIAMSRSQTMKLQQKLRMSQPKVRASAGFGSIICSTRLGFCWFQQIADQAV